MNFTICTQPCNETFVCKVCGKTMVPTGAGSDQRNHLERIEEMTRLMDGDGELKW